MLNLPDSPGATAPLGHLFSSDENFNRDGSNRLPVVLVVDDDVDSITLISYVLESFNCALFCETNGIAALNLIRRLNPDLIMLDIRLPGLSGIEILQALRSHELTRTIPVVIVSALGKGHYQQKAMQAGGNQYISKPYLLTDIQRTVSLYLAPHEDTLPKSEHEMDSMEPMEADGQL